MKRLLTALVAAAAISVVPVARADTYQPNASDFRVTGGVADINNGTSTLDLEGRVDRRLVEFLSQATRFQIGLAFHYDIQLICANSTDPSQTTTVSGRLTDKDETFPQPWVRSSRTVSGVGSQLHWIAHLEVEANAARPEGLDAPLRCPSGYEATGPIETVGMVFTVYPTDSMFGSPPPTKQGRDLFFSLTLAPGVTVIK